SRPASRVLAPTAACSKATSRSTRAPAAILSCSTPSSGSRTAPRPRKKPTSSPAPPRASTPGEITIGHRSDSGAAAIGPHPRPRHHHGGGGGGGHGEGGGGGPAAPVVASPKAQLIPRSLAAVPPRIAMRSSSLRPGIDMTWSTGTLFHGNG